jgi:alpha-mannosidase
MFVLLCSFAPSALLITAGAASSSGMVYDDAEKLYAEVRADTEALVDKALRVLYPGSLPLSSTAPVPTSGKLTVFAHNTTPFARRDVVRVPLGEGGISSENVLLQRTSDGKGGYIVLEGGQGGGLVLPSQINATELTGAFTFIAAIGPLSLTSARRCHGT